MKSKLFTLKEATDLIKQGRLLVIAAAEKLLTQLPDGNWIGGSNPYLLGEGGGMYSEEMLYLKDFTDVAIDFKMCSYDASSIANITTDAFENSMIVAVFPAFTEVLTEFSVKSPEFENQYINPLLGWVSGAAFEKMGIESPTVYIGSKKKFSDKAVALHIQLPSNKVGRIEIVNPYEPGDGDIITFEHDGWTNQECFINGVRTNLYDYLQKRGDLYLPFVADYSGAMINVAIMLDNENKKVNWFAPAFKNTEYRTARHVKTDYIQYLTDKVAHESSELEYSYSCLYNYFNFALEKKPVPGLVGTFTFGEIGYQLLNVSFVYLVIEDKVG